MSLTAEAAWAFLPAAAPICFWVAWSDMARMRIPNKAVLALVAAFLLLGPLALPLDLWARQWLALALVLGAGFCANIAGAMGAGDAKFAAAAALFVLPGDAARVLVLLAAMLLAGVAAHRGARALRPVRALAPGWASWDNPRFPMGLPLAGTLLAHLVLAVLWH